MADTVADLADERARRTPWAAAKVVVAREAVAAAAAAAATATVAVVAVAKVMAVEAAVTAAVVRWSL